MATIAVETDKPEGASLPEGWRWHSLRSLTSDYFSGKRPKGGVSGISEGALSLGGEHLNWDGTIDLTTPRRIPQAFADAMANSEVAIDDILIVKDGATTGKTAFVRSLPERAFVNEHVFVLRPTAEVLPKYLFYWLWSRPGFEQIMLDFRGATQGGIGRTFVDKVSVPWTSIETQRRIVAGIDELFSELDDGDEALRRARGELETYRKALLKAAVTGELTAAWRAANPPKESGANLLARILADRRARWEADPKNKGKRYKEPTQPDLSNVPALPVGWAWASLDQLCTTETRNGLSLKASPGTSAVKALRLDALQDAGVLWDRTRFLPIEPARASPYLLEDQDLLISRANGSPEFVGRCSRAANPPPDVIFPDTAIRYRLLMPKLVSWVEAAWRSPFCRARLLRAAKTTAGILKVSQGDIAAVPIPLPPLEEAMELTMMISSSLAQADVLAVDVADQAADSIMLRQSILAAAFRGELIQ